MYILNSMILQLINITALWNTDVISWRDKLHSVIDPPLMMAQSQAESIRDIYNYGQYINQFPPNTIKVIREFEQIQKKICRHKNIYYVKWNLY